MADEYAPSGIQWNPHSEHAKEMRKWEQHHSTFGPPGNPYVFRPYPRMVYRAFPDENGKVQCGMVPGPYATDIQVSKAETFTKQCQRIVPDESAHAIAKGQGWCDSPQEALAQAEQTAQAVGNAAAEAAYQARRMTDSARREYDEADRATAKHVVDVQPKRKRGRPAKGIVPVIGTGAVAD